MKIYNYFKNMAEENIIQEFRFKDMDEKKWINEYKAWKDLYDSKLNFLVSSFYNY